uniref:Ataxin 7 like 1 n=1 Tax=Amphiprion percula TaxID=161767 RepID=A0A3P8TS37_AMPPE
RTSKISRIQSKQQERRAMATLDRQIPSPDTFLCEPWSSFVSAAKLRFVDTVKLSEHGKEVVIQWSCWFVMMLVYSQFPTLEDFCLVVCRVCSKVVTPQGILTHYGKINRPLRAQSHTSLQYRYVGVASYHTEPQNQHVHIYAHTHSHSDQYSHFYVFLQAALNITSLQPVLYTSKQHTVNAQQADES